MTRKIQVSLFKCLFLVCDTSVLVVDIKADKSDLRIKLYTDNVAWLKPIIQYLPFPSVNKQIQAIIPVAPQIHSFLIKPRFRSLIVQFITNPEELMAYFIELTEFELEPEICLWAFANWFVDLAWAPLTIWIMGSQRSLQLKICIPKQQPLGAEWQIVEAGCKGFPLVIRQRIPIYSQTVLERCRFNFLAETWFWFDWDCLVGIKFFMSVKVRSMI